MKGSKRGGMWVCGTDVQEHIDLSSRPSDVDRLLLWTVCLFRAAASDLRVTERHARRPNWIRVSRANVAAGVLGRWAARRNR